MGLRLPLLLGLLLAFAVAGLMLGVAAVFPVQVFPSGNYACAINSIAPEDCTAGARWVGTLNVLAYGGVIALALWRRWLMVAVPAESTVREATASEYLFVAGSLTVMGIHLGLIQFGPAFVSRLNESSAYGHFVSMENLALPALLQLYLYARPRSFLKMALGVSLLMGMILSPYRAMVVALYAFGFLLPLAEQAWTAVWSKRRRQEFPAFCRRNAMTGLFALLLGAAVVQAGIQDTKMRSPSWLAMSMGLSVLPREHTAPADTKEKAPGGQVIVNRSGQRVVLPAPPADMLMPPGDLKTRLGQRVAFPLYQAVMAGHLVDSGVEMPTLTDQLLRKLRLSDAPNLEEFLFRHIYGGAGLGETTSLIYGEARAYFPGPPILWMMAVPVLLIFAWRYLARKGVETDVLFGFALWRTSFAGLMPILPSLFLQSLALWGCRTFPMQRLKKTAHALLVLTLLAVGAIQVWALGAALAGRNDILYARYDLTPGCYVQARSMVADVIGDAALVHGKSMNVVVSAMNRTSVLVAFPAGMTTQPVLDDASRAIAGLSVCLSDPQHPAQPQAVSLKKQTLVNRQISFLGLLAAAGFLFAVWYGLRAARRPEV